MKHLLLTTIAAVVLVGCGPSVDIHEAAEAGNIEAVKQYLADGEDVNANDEFGFTPLLHAASSGHKEIVELLISNGANVNAKGDLGTTPLLWAAINGHKEVVELLIAKGADVMAKRAGRTPLHRAASNGHKEIVELIIAAGANVNAKNDDGETPLDWAVALNPTEIANLLRKHGGKTGEELKVEGK
jgi:ankyrin repeat protein